MASEAKIRAFRKSVWAYYARSGRHDLPWRKTGDPYKILVSEVMLQQTQVPRVLEKYKEFLQAFPTVRALAKASLADVLRVWSGLGYNRRGKYMHDAAKKIVTDFGGDFKKALKDPLPGVGPYTRSAIKAFAFNEPGIFIETNIRTAFIHHFYSSILQNTAISDRELIPLIEATAKGQDPRTWNWALMDYGSHLKKSGVRNNVRSAHYTKQSKFEGSLRQLRGEILRQLHSDKQPKGDSRLQVALTSLLRDGLIVKEKGKWRIA